ncbi:MAG: peptide deformylase, partial [Phycisphaerales bacterium]
MAEGSPSAEGGRPVVLFPDPMLRRKAQPVRSVDAAVRELVADMFRTMDLEDGAGLAAPQVGESVRVFVTGTSERDVPRRAFINPVIVDVGGELEWMEEGCLSLPGIRGSVRRPVTVTIRAFDLEGREFEETRSDFAARVWQHELDHLDG